MHTNFNLLILRYATFNYPGCPFYGSLFPNEDGVDANSACCYCKDTDNENQTGSPSQTIDMSSKNPTSFPSQEINESLENPTISPANSDNGANNNTPSGSSAVTGRFFVIAFMFLLIWI